MNVKFEARFSKDLRRIKDGSLLKRIKELIVSCQEAESLAEIRQVKKLKGYDTFYRVRIGNYRIGVELVQDELVFVRCLHRKEVYRYFPR
ncbi:MAG: type II toxin-antitoxin system RelE/ParE family toxin [Candidatus Electrothrix sp. Rat3]|nr:type II toxin-antitoxin system RelE/ParE family toxin [Candidatus Electrothrix rattekaaiensis]